MLLKFFWNWDDVSLVSSLMKNFFPYSQVSSCLWSPHNYYMAFNVKLSNPTWLDAIALQSRVNAAKFVLPLYLQSFINCWSTGALWTYPSRVQNFICHVLKSNSVNKKTNQSEMNENDFTNICIRKNMRTSENFATFCESIGSNVLC